MTPLLSELLSLLEAWRPAFARRRSAIRAITHALALSLTVGRRTITRVICLKGRAYDDGWGTEYKLFSRAPWEPSKLFVPVWNEFRQRYPEHPFIPVALDDTGISKTGKMIPDARWMRDPMSPPFQVNLILGLRFIQAGLLFPHYRESDCPARSVPVAFDLAPHVKKPGRRATEEEVAAYRLAVKTDNLSAHGSKLVQRLRQEADRAGFRTKPLMVAVDGSYCNKRVFKTDFERTHLIARCRKDAKLCFPAQTGSRKKYDSVTFTPEDVLADSERSFKTARVYLARNWRVIRYKEISDVLWRGGAGQRPLRVIVVEPQPYRRTKSSRLRRRDPSFLLTTDLKTQAQILLQVYCDRWQIEVNHLEEKSVFGVGEAQVRSRRSVPRHPALAVATYSLLLLAGLRAFGPGRTNSYHVLPRWRRRSLRPSILDLLTLLRTEIQASLPHGAQDAHEAGDPELLQQLQILFIGANAENLVHHAYT